MRSFPSLGNYCSSLDYLLLWLTESFKTLIIYKGSTQEQEINVQWALELIKLGWNSFARSPGGGGGGGGGGTSL